MDARLPCRVARRAALALTAILTVSGRAAHADERPVRIGLNVWPGSAALTFAHEKLSLFAKHKLVERRDFELVHHDNYPTMVERFVGGSIDVTQLSIYDAVEAIAKGKRFAAFAVPVDNRGYDLLVTRPDRAAAIKSARDLRGRKVAFADGSIGEFLVRRLLAESGLRFEDITPRHYPHLTAWCAVKQGFVDAGIVIFPVWEPSYPEIAGTQNYSLPNLWVIGEETLKERPRLPVALLEIWEEAQTAIRRNPNVFDDYMVKRFRFARLAACGAQPTETAAASEVMLRELRARVPLLSLARSSAAYWQPGGGEDIWRKADQIAGFLLGQRRSAGQQKLLRGFRTSPERWLRRDWLEQKGFLRPPTSPDRPAAVAAAGKVAAYDGAPPRGAASWFDRWDGRRGKAACALCAVIPLPLLVLLGLLLRRRLRWRRLPLAVTLLLVWSAAAGTSSWIYRRSFSTLRLVTVVWPNEKACEREFGAARSLLEQQLGRPVQLRIIDIAEAQPTLNRAAYDVFSMSAGIYVNLVGAESLRYLGRFEFREHGLIRNAYRSAIVARVGSGIRTFADLRSRRVVYVDSRSSSGYLVPHHFFANLRDYLEQHPALRARHFPSVAPDRIPKNLELEFQYFFSGDHGASRQLLDLGQADAIATGDFEARDPKIYGTDRYLIVGDIPIEIPTQILTVRRSLPESTASRVVEVFRSGLVHLPLGEQRKMVGFKPETSGAEGAMAASAFTTLRRIASRKAAEEAGAVKKGPQEVWLLESESRFRITERIQKTSGIKVARGINDLEGKPVGLHLEWRNVFKDVEGGSAEVTVYGQDACARPLLDILHRTAGQSRWRCDPPGAGDRPHAIKCWTKHRTDKKLLEAVAWLISFWHLSAAQPRALLDRRSHEFRATVDSLPVGTTEAPIALRGPALGDCRLAALVPLGDLSPTGLRANAQLTVFDGGQPKRFRLQDDVSKLSIITPLSVQGMLPWESRMPLYLVMGVGAVCLIVVGAGARRLLRRRAVRPDPTFKAIRNIYIVGNPVKSSDMFFGRDQEFQQIRHWVLHNGPKVILLKGGRRSGKTSILFQIANGRLGADAGVPAFLDFHSIAPRLRQDDDVALRICDAILAAEVFHSIAISSDGGPAERLLTTVDRALASIAPRPLVLLGDEAEALEALIADGQLSVRAFQWLRPLFDRHVFLIATSSRQFGSHLGPMVNSITQIKDISLFSFEDAAALVQQPVAGQLRYQPGAVEAIFRLSGGQPFFVQYICQTLIQQINLQHKRRVVLSLDLAGVIDFVVRNPHGHLHETWRALAPAEQSALAALANAIRHGHEFLDDATILRMMQERRFPGDAGSLHAALAGLLQRTHLLERQANKVRYRCDLLRHWIRYSYQTGEDLDAR
jgi:ABC-type nitrate/sulfonate/bicarbonate transport system substrate-binding protein